MWRHLILNLTYMEQMETVPKNNFKKYVVGSAVVLVVVVLVAYGSWWMYHQNPEITKTADLHLSSDQTNQRTSLIQNIQSQIDAAEARNAPVEERFKLYSQLGNEQYAIGKYAEAKDALLTAQKLLPDNPTSYQDLYAVYSAMHDYNAALEMAKKSVEVNSASVANWNNYITLEKEHFGMSTSDRLKLFEQAVVKTGNAPEIVRAYGMTYEEKGDYKQAYTLYRTLVDKYPTNADYRADVERVVSKQNTGK